MKVKTSFPVASISGSPIGDLGRSTFRTRNGATQLMKRPTHDYAPTTLQAQIETVRATLATAWATGLTTIQRNSWINAATTLYEASGYTLFLRLMWPRAAFGLSVAQSYAAYTGQNLDIETPNPSLYWDQDQTPPLDPTVPTLHLFNDENDDVTITTLPSGPCLAFARFTRLPLPPGRKLQNHMLTAINSQSLAASMIEITSFLVPGTWGSNLCANGTFTNNSTAGWAGDIQCNDDMIYYEDTTPDPFYCTSWTPTPGRLTRISFNIQGDVNVTVGMTCGSYEENLTPITTSPIFEFTPTTTNPLTFNVNANGGGRWVSIDDIIIDEWTEPTNEGWYWGTLAIPSDLDRATISLDDPYYANVKVYDKETGAIVYDMTTEVTLNARVHD
jgi:hypothetical protein